MDPTNPADKSATLRAMGDPVRTNAIIDAAMAAHDLIRKQCPNDLLAHVQVMAFMYAFLEGQSEQSTSNLLEATRTLLSLYEDLAHEAFILMRSKGKGEPQA